MMRQSESPVIYASLKRKQNYITHKFHVEIAMPLEGELCFPLLPVTLHLKKMLMILLDVYANMEGRAGSVLPHNPQPQQG